MFLIRFLIFMKKDTVVDYKKLLYMVFVLHNRHLFTKNLTKLG